MNTTQYLRIAEHYKVLGAYSEAWHHCRIQQGFMGVKQGSEVTYKKSMYFKKCDNCEILSWNGDTVWTFTEWKGTLWSGTWIRTLIAPTTEFNIPYVQKAVQLIIQNQFYFWFGLSMFWCPFFVCFAQFWFWWWHSGAKMFAQLKAVKWLVKPRPLWKFSFLRLRGSHWEKTWYQMQRNPSYYLSFV